MKENPARPHNLDSINAGGIKPPKVTVSDTAKPKTQINLTTAHQYRKPRRSLHIVLALIFAAILGLGSILFIRADNLSQKIFVGQKTTFLEKLIDVIRGGGSNQTLVGENLGQVNILLLGIGGEGHDGPYLTDTMIVAQIRPDIGEVALISIPRDYWTQMPCGADSEKINAAFSEGYFKNHDWNEAGQCAILAAQNLTGLQIPYFAVLDFSGFRQAIDEVNGVDVTVDRTFTDYQYPNDATNGYLPPLTFTAGLQHMDGTRALEFARSRHAAGIEGSDFARSQRQQKIITAFKQKILSLNLITNAGALNSLLSTLADHFHTDLSPAEILRIYELSKQRNINDFISVSLDPSTGLICPQTQAITGAYILTPCPGKTSDDIKVFFKNIFTTGKVAQEKATVWVSGTGAQAVVDQLDQAGANAYSFSYAGQTPSQTVFYQVNPKPATAEYIKNTFNATEVTLPPPSLNINSSKTDIIVVLGNNN